LPPEKPEVSFGSHLERSTFVPGSTLCCCMMASFIQLPG
jgi:hypothetical protein